MKTLDLIKKDIDLLPEKDKKIAQQCIEQRDFNRLLEIVESYCIKLRKLQIRVEDYARANDVILYDVFNDEAFDI